MITIKTGDEYFMCVRCGYETTSQSNSCSNCFTRSPRWIRMTRTETGGRINDDY